jgi:hypothetical protein
MKPCSSNIRPSSISRKDVGNDFQQSTGWVSETRRPGLAAPRAGLLAYGLTRPWPVAMAPISPHRVTDRRSGSGIIGTGGGSQTGGADPASAAGGARTAGSVVRRLAMSPAPRCRRARCRSSRSRNAPASPPAPSTAISRPRTISFAALVAVIAEQEIAAIRRTAAAAQALTLFALRALGVVDARARGLVVQAG